MKPQVKPSEKSRILSTRDYSLFEFPDETKLSEKHLEIVKASLQEKNLLADFPILIDDKYNILDGKYKFIAAYQLKLPINYKLAEVTTKMDAIRIKEILKRTPFRELIEVYIEIESYANLAVLRQEFFNTHRFSFEQIIRAIDEARTYKASSPKWSASAQKMVPNKPWECSLVIDRSKIASGKLANWDYAKLKLRLEKIATLMDMYSWDFYSALRLCILTDDGFDMDSRRNKDLLSRADSHLKGYREYAGSNVYDNRYRNFLNDSRTDNWLIFSHFYHVSKN